MNSTDPLHDADDPLLAAASAYQAALDRGEAEPELDMSTWSPEMCRKWQLVKAMVRIINDDSTREFLKQTYPAASRPHTGNADSAPEQVATQVAHSAQLPRRARPFLVPGRIAAALLVVSALLGWLAYADGPELQRQRAEQTIEQGEEFRFNGSERLWSFWPAFGKSKSVGPFRLAYGRADITSSGDSKAMSVRPLDNGSCLLACPSPGSNRYHISVEMDDLSWGTGSVIGLYIHGRVAEDQDMRAAVFVGVSLSDAAPTLQRSAEGNEIQETGRMKVRCILSRTNLHSKVIGESESSVGKPVSFRSAGWRHLSVTVESNEVVMILGKRGQEGDQRTIRIDKKELEDEMVRFVNAAAMSGKLSKALCEGLKSQSGEEEVGVWAKGGGLVVRNISMVTPGGHP